jgi:NAD(P)-dependent dehydrogenase (short-subunit alcohol dehydrogenase family)
VSVEGNTVIITGAARGHGRSIAVAFASQGARLALVDILPLDQTILDCRAYQAEVAGFPTDLRDPEAVRVMADRVHATYGRIDVLINDAAINPHFAYGKPRWRRIAELDPAFFENILRTNLFGTFHTMRYVLPYMEAQGGGHVVNFGQGNVGRPIRPGNARGSPYHTSKVAIRALTNLMAVEELDYNVCVVAFGPGGPGGQTPEENVALAAQINLDLGMKLVLAAQAPMSMTGRMVDVRDGRLVLAADELPD